MAAPMNSATWTDSPEEAASDVILHLEALAAYVDTNQARSSHVSESTSGVRRRAWHLLTAYPLHVRTVCPVWQRRCQGLAR